MAHIWGEHYDRQLDDIFAIQDEITQMIAARLARQARTAIASAPGPDQPATCRPMKVTFAPCSLPANMTP